MDYFVNPWTWLAIAVFVGVIVAIFYHFRLEPIIQLPLANEEDLGTAEFSLPNLGKLNVGRITTAMNTFKGFLDKAITSADDLAKKALIAWRDVVFKGYLIAQRCGRDKIIYLCDENPMDPNFHVRKDKGSNPTRYIHANDSINLGELNGFTLIGVKMGKGTARFSEMERSVYELCLTGVGWIKIAAFNQGKIKALEDRVKTQESVIEKERKDNASLSSRLDIALNALDQFRLRKSLEAKLGGVFAQKLKEWFTLPQLITLAFAFFLSGPIIGFLSDTQHWNVQPPTTTWLTALICILGFFCIPIFKKVFGRWL